MLTDSMLTEFGKDLHGVVQSVSLEPSRSLRIDSKTVCAFRCFAGPTAFRQTLNSALIIGRYRDRLRGLSKNGIPLSFSNKLDMLEDVASYYLTGIANIRDGNTTDDYRFELFLAGYETDGTPQIGTLELRTVSQPIAAGQFLKSTTYVSIVE
jgi:hypothetical protein